MIVEWHYEFCMVGILLSNPLIFFPYPEIAA